MKRINIFRLCNNSGQALVENVLVIPIIVVIIVMLFWFAEIMLTKQQLVMAARYGTDLILYSNMTNKQIKAEIQGYLCGRGVEGRLLDPKKLTITDDNIVNNKSKCVKVNIINMWNPNDYSQSSTSFVELYYEFDAPKLFYAWARYIGGEGMSKKLRIGARSEVLAGTGCQGEN